MVPRIDSAIAQALKLIEVGCPRERLDLSSALHDNQAARGGPIANTNGLARGDAGSLGGPLRTPLDPRI